MVFGGLSGDGLAYVLNQIKEINKE